MIQEDSINVITQAKVVSSVETKDSLARFFVEKGEVQIIETKRLEKNVVPLWMHLSLLLWVIVIVFARQSYTMRLRQIFVATINPKQVKQLQREGNILNQGFPVILLFLFVFTITLFAFITINQYFLNSFYFSSGEGFLILFGVVSFYHLLKFTAIWFSGALFETQRVSIRYLLDHFLFHISEGILLFPLLILFVYSGMLLFLYIALTVLLLLWVYRLQRAIIIGLACTNFSRSYLFLYLCTLEVLPIFLLYKLSGQFI